MSYRLLKTLTLGSACIFSLACTSIPSSPSTIVTPVDISEWETRLPADKGTIKITFTLPQQAKAEFQVFNGKPSQINSALMRVILNDENCSSGHLGVINYKKSNLEYLIRYFEKEAAWNSTNTIVLSWNSNNQITTTLNNEVISIAISNQANTLKIVSQFSPITIKTFEYLPLQ